MNGVWNGCDFFPMEFTTLRRLQQIILLSSLNSIKKQIQRWKINFPPEMDISVGCLLMHWHPSILTCTELPLHLSPSPPRWVTLFSLSPRPRQMKMNDCGQALSCYVPQCYLNTINRCIYECHTSMINSHVPIVCALIFLYCFIVSKARYPIVFTHTTVFYFDLMGTCACHSHWGAHEWKKISTRHILI